jgi:hypothetical protein
MARRVTLVFFTIVAPLAAAGCGKKSSPLLTYDQSLEIEKDENKALVFWVWEKETGRPLYGVARCGKGASLGIAPDKPRPSVDVDNQRAIGPPAEDGHVYVIDANYSWQPTPVTVDQLRKWRETAGKMSDPLWKETLTPILLKFRWDKADLK